MKNIKPAEPITRKRLRMRPFMMKFFAGLAVVTVLGYVGYWFWLANEISDGIDAWAAAEQAEGRIVAFGEREISGFPGDMQFSFQGISYEDRARGRTLHLPALTGSMSPLDLGRIIGHAEGPLVVILEKGPAPGRYEISAADNAIRYRAAEPQEVVVNMRDVRVSGAEALDGLTAKKFDIGLERGSVPVFGTFSIDAEGIDLPPVHATPLAGTARYLQVVADLKGAVPPAAITSAGLEAWRKDGGDIDFRKLAFGHGDADVAAEGTLALDDELQPIAAFTAKVSGFAETIDTLIQAGYVRPQEGGMAKAVLGFLARTPKGGGPPTLGAAISVQDRELSVGPVKLMRLPYVRWDD
jgi:hypothetical protein